MERVVSRRSNFNVPSLLRYTTESCDNMAPVYKDENFNSLDLGPEVEKKDKNDEDDDSNKGWR